MSIFTVANKAFQGCDSEFIEMIKPRPRLQQKSDFTLNTSKSFIVRFATNVYFQLILWNTIIVVFFPKRKDFLEHRYQKAQRETHV